jgi:hypothetical protein
VRSNSAKSASSSCDMRSCSRRVLIRSPNVTSSARSLGTSGSWCYDDRVSTDKESQWRRDKRFSWSLDEIEIERDGRVLDLSDLFPSPGFEVPSDESGEGIEAPLNAEGSARPAAKDRPSR